ncbi:MAG TPA: helix-hairpin-helix domain-containing protein [Ktedonosporobacter sp.]|nr:helix-hairpin-helix domain-containing protein [Ktedonosporobacter sp.]
MSIMQLTQTIHIMPPLQSKPGRKQPIQPALPGMEPEENQPVRVTNRQIAEVLSSIGDLLASQNGNPYRIQAYRNAARGVLDLAEPAADIIARGEKLPIEGLGERLRSRINELVQLGTMTFQNGLYMQTLPVGVRTLMAVEHIGPYTAIRLHEELGVDSLEKLWWAAQHQRIRRLPGFGPRSEARLKKAAEQILSRRKQAPREEPVSLGGVA